MPHGIAQHVRLMSASEFLKTSLRGITVVVLAEGALEELCVDQAVLRLSGLAVHVGVASAVQGDLRLVEWGLAGVGHVVRYDEVSSFVARRRNSPSRRPRLLLIDWASTLPIELTPRRCRLLRQLPLAKTLSVQGWVARLRGCDRHRLKRVLGLRPREAVRSLRQAIARHLIERDGRTWRDANAAVGYANASNMHRMFRRSDEPPPRRVSCGHLAAQTDHNPRSK